MEPHAWARRDWRSRRCGARRECPARCFRDPGGLRPGGAPSRPAAHRLCPSERHDAAQVALAWLISHDDVIAIPRTGSRHRLQENARALDVRLTPDQLAELNVVFPPPSHPIPLEML